MSESTDATVYHGHPYDPDYPDEDVLMVPTFDGYRADTAGSTVRLRRAEQHVQLMVRGLDVSCETLAQLEIRGGRGDKLSQPEPASVAFTTEWPNGSKAPTVGDEVAIYGWLPGSTPAESGAALFYGNITDIAQEGIWWSVVAVSPLRRLDGIYVGDTPWPTEAEDARIERVWDQVRQRAGTPSWMPDNLLTQLVFGLPHVNVFVWARDVDHQTALDLLYHYLNPLQAAFGYRPDVHWPSPDRTAWRPTTMLTSGFNTVSGWTIPQCYVPSCLIVADPPPRFWQNMGVIINDMRVQYLGTPKPNDNQHPQLTVSAQASLTLRTRYGPRSATVSTELLDDFLGTPVHDAQTLAEAWIDRHQVSTWSVDNVQIRFVEPLLDQLSTAEQLGAWSIVAWGAEQMGRYVNLGGIPSHANNAWDFNQGGGWMVEQTVIAWTSDGWTVTVGCSNPISYAGNVIGQTQVSIGQPPQHAGSAGIPLSVEVTRPYDHHQFVLGGTLSVNGGPAVPVVGPVMMVPTGPLTSGANTLTVTYTPRPGSGDLASSATVSINGHLNWLTWDDIRPSATWDGIPAATTWDTAKQQDDFGT